MIVYKSTTKIGEDFSIHPFMYTAIVIDMACMIELVDHINYQNFMKIKLSADLISAGRY